MSRLSELLFTDIYIGKQFCDFKGLAGATTSRVAAPETVLDEVAQLRQCCVDEYAAQEDPEFSVFFGELSFRVTVVQDMRDGEVFILRPTSSLVRPFKILPLSESIKQTLLNPALRGLVLVAGEMAAGKTSTAVSLVVERLTLFGGICIAVEDPNEYRLTGLHGEGRCIQVRASKKNGGYQEQLKRAMRSGADILFIGEIRDDATAYEAVNASINGCLVISTIHAGNPVQAVERILTYSKRINQDSAELLADGLSAVIYQQLDKDYRGEQLITRLKSITLDLSDCVSGRAKLRAGNVDHLVHEIEEQANKKVWKKSGANDA